MGESTALNILKNAILLERRGKAFYSERAEASEDPDEKALYQWLAEWEHQHLDFLAEIDRQLTEAIWHDNSFWPF